jgi:hypothetical protein
MLVAGHDGWRRRGSQPGLLDAEVGHATQYLLKHDPQYEVNHIGADAAVGAQGEGHVAFVGAVDSAPRQ